MPPATAGKLVTALSTPPPSSLPKTAREALRLLRAGRNVVIYGAPGTGKTYAALQLRNQWLAANGPGSVILTTFHPSYAYEDFIQGWRPDKDADQFQLTDGVLLEAASLAESHGRLDPPRDVLLVIDEINRADVARTFGEVITYLERDKRELPFTTAQERTRTRSIPENLYVLGTMNTADKSISLLDVALRRRFAFILCPPDADAFASVDGWASTVAGVRLRDVLNGINDRLARNSVDLDRQLGHALLGVSDDANALQALADRLSFDVLPLVEEYFYSDPQKVAEVLPGLVQADGRHIPVDISHLGSLLSRLTESSPSGLASPSSATFAGQQPADADAEVSAEETPEDSGSAPSPGRARGDTGNPAGE